MEWKGEGDSALNGPCFDEVSVKYRVKNLELWKNSYNVNINGIHFDE